MSGDCGCRKECYKLIAKDERSVIKKYYWHQYVHGKTSFIKENVKSVEVKRRVQNRHVLKLKKQHAYKFAIPAADGTSILVCRKFFLNTLGENCG